MSTTEPLEADLLLLPHSPLWAPGPTTAGQATPTESIDRDHASRIRLV